MQINNLLKNPLIRIFATILIVYFALFADKKNPDSLGNRLSKERINKNFTEIKQKSNFIKKNIDTAKKIAQENESNPVTEAIKSNMSVKCGDKVITNYEIYTDDVKVNQIENLEFVVGSKQNWIIEESIIGMKLNEVRNIDVLNELTKNQKNPIKNNLQNKTEYKITILNIIRNPDNNLSCNKQFPK